jgi:hypothetical protein
MRKSIGLVLCLVYVSAWGTDSRFFRVGCVEGEPPANIAITSDESGALLLEFDTVDQSNYTIQATSRLESFPVWGVVASVTGDGGRAKAPTAQRWSRTFGGALGDQGNCVCQLPDGCYVLAGGTDSYGEGGDVYLVKVTGSGTEVWSRTLGGTSADWANSIRPTSDGGYIMAGVTYSYGEGIGDAYLLKADENGYEVWKNTFGGELDDRAECVGLTSDGGYIVAGYTESFGAGEYDFYLVKADQDGQEMWTKTFGGSADDQAKCVQQTSDGGYILAGMSRSFDPAEYSDCLLVRTDSDGNEIWSKNLGGSSNEEAHWVQQTSDGGYIVAGLTTSFGAGLTDVYLLKTDENGNQVWHNWLGGSGREEAYCVQQTSDGGYILAGRTTSTGAGEYDVYLVKTRSNGSEVWSRTFGGTGRDLAYSVCQTFDGGYILTGYTCSFDAAVSEMYVIKTDGDGNAPLPE